MAILVLPSASQTLKSVPDGLHSRSLVMMLRPLLYSTSFPMLALDRYRARKGIYRLRCVNSRSKKSSAMPRMI